MARGIIAIHSDGSRVVGTPGKLNFGALTSIIKSSALPDLDLVRTVSGSPAAQKRSLVGG